MDREPATIDHPLSPPPPGDDDQPGQQEAGPTGQRYIDGLAPPRIPELDEVAIKYREIVRDRLELQQEERQLKTHLLELMQDNELAVYPIPDTEYEVARESRAENVKVRQRATED